MSHTIHNADIKEWAKNYEGELFDGIFCDPPYELGFMGKGWDSSGIAFDVEMWQDIYKLLKPGGHLLAFSGSRTYHRMAVAIEDAGFEIRDQLIWMYGSGFPKSLNIGKAVDKIQGNEREDLGVRHGATGKRNSKIYGDRPVLNDPDYQPRITKGTSEWEGYGTALKPAHEPCVLARKPIDKGMTVAGNVLKYGAGGLNIDGTRVGTEQIEQGRQVADSSSYHDGLKPTERTIATGRFPANLIHDGSDEVEAVFPQTKVEIHNKPASSIFGNEDDGGSRGFSVKDSGSASRYFYTAKAGKRERNAGLEGFEERPLENHSSTFNVRMENGVATNARTDTARQNHHPTVKPLALTKYLATLIKPPTGGRLLVPFSGSGSEMIGALQAGWSEVVGVELTEEYIPIAEARIKYWLAEMAKEDEQPEQGQLV